MSESIISSLAQLVVVALLWRSGVTVYVQTAIELESKILGFIVAIIAVFVLALSMSYLAAKY